MRSVGVFCGSSAGVRPEYAAAAAELGRQIAGRGMSLVYGGARVGLMGVVADAALCAGGRVTGVLPAHLRDREIAHLGLTDLRVVGSIHERKALMAELSDGFVALPGGFGTLDELAEVLTWSQLGLHAKPCGLLDVAAFWRPLLTFVDHAVGEGFVRAEHRRLLVDADEPAALLDRMAAWRAPAVEKWVTPAGAPVAGASVAAPPIDGPLAGGPPGAVPPVGGPPGAVPPVGGPPGSAPPRPPSLHG